MINWWYRISAIMVLIAALYFYATDDVLKGIFWAVLLVGLIVFDNTVVCEQKK